MFSTPTNRATCVSWGRLKISLGAPTWSISPPIRTPIRSARRCPWAMSWVVMTTVARSSPMTLAIRPSTLEMETGSRLAVGSSRRSSSGSVTIALARATR